MTQADFLELLKSVLQFRGVAFDRGALLTFVTDAWPLVEDDPDVERWPDEFLQTSAASRGRKP